MKKKIILICGLILIIILASIFMSFKNNSLNKNNTSVRLSLAYPLQSN